MNRTTLAAVCALLAFAANSILCRMALLQTKIDPASFTSVRLVAGAVTLWILIRLSKRPKSTGGDWISAFALLAYAVAFSFAYLGVTAGTGALLLFGAVQLIMIAAGLLARERVDAWSASGWTLAVAGVGILILPGVSATPTVAAALMLCAGGAWGLYSLRGRRSNDPLHDTAGNFARAAPGALVISAMLWPHSSFDARGMVLATLSGALASGLGYSAWYLALRRLSAIAAANVQLTVPVITALGGVLLFGEPITLRLGIATVLVLGGVTLATRRLNLASDRQGK